MPAITFGGINTGLPPNIVEKIVEAEGIPIRNLEVRKTKVESKLNLVTELESLIRGVESDIKELANTKGFNDTKLESSDASIVSGVVDPGVTTKGNWNIEVIELAQKASAVTNGFPDKDVTEVGVGYLEFKTANGTKEVYVDGSNNTLSGVAKAINAAGLGLKATVINDRSDPDAPFKLVVSGESVGNENTIEYPTVYFLDGDQDFFFDEEKAAKNGKVKVDGFEMEIAANELTDVIPGVTLDLKQAVPGKTVNVSVKEDMDVVSGKIDKFVESLNKILAFIQSQSRIDAKTDTSKTLGGDTLIRTVARRMRDLVQGQQLGLAGEIKSLNQLGIVFNRAGTLDFDKDKFTAVLAKNSKDVEIFFAGDGFATGFIPVLKNTIKNLSSSSFSPIANRKSGLTQNISRIDEQIANKQKQLERREETLRRQFSKLEETMSKLKSQGASVGAIGGGGGGAGALNLSGASTGGAGPGAGG